MNAVKRRTLSAIRERIVESANQLATILHLEANGMTMAEAGNISLMVTSQLNSLEKKVRVIEMELNEESPMTAQSLVQDFKDMGYDSKAIHDHFDKK